MSLAMERDTPALHPSGEACQAHKMQLGYSPPKDDKAAVLGTSHGVPYGQTAGPSVSQDMSEKTQYGFFPSLSCELGYTTVHHCFLDFPLPKTQRKSSYFSADAIWSL